MIFTIPAILAIQQTVPVPFYTEGVENVPWTFGYSDVTNGITTKMDDHLLLEIPQGYYGMLSFVTDVTVDLTYINTLYIDWEFTVESTVNSAFAYLMGSTYKEGDHNQYDGFRLYIAEAQANVRRVDSISVKNLTGNFYLRNCVRNAISNGAILKTYRIWGE